MKKVLTFLVDVLQVIREWYISLCIIPFFALTVWIQVGGTNSWPLTHLSFVCFLSWLGGVLMSWRFIEYAVDRYAHQRTYRTWSVYASIAGTCTGLATLFAVLAQMTLYTIFAVMLMLIQVIMWQLAHDEEEREKKALQREAVETSPLQQETRVKID